MKLPIRSLLVFLVLLDVSLALATLFFPEVWFSLVHGETYWGHDPEGLLRRTGALWAAFTLFQLVTLMKWERNPHWLVLVAGIRSTEIFSDWAYVYFAAHVTPLGKLGLLVSPPANLFFTLFFLWAYRTAAGARG